MTQLIVAMDMPPSEISIRLREATYGSAAWFKYGVSALLDPEGLYHIRDQITRDKKIMLDLKLYDTRDTVRRVLDDVARLGVSMVTVHADCVGAAIEGWENRDADALKIIAVQTLTSDANQTVLSNISADGVVCPPSDIGRVRSLNPNLILVTPGIRPRWYKRSHNHVKPATPGFAARAGADFIVVGRPIYESADPAGAVRRILDEIAQVP